MDEKERGEENRGEAFARARALAHRVSAIAGELLASSSSEVERCELRQVERQADALRLALHIAQGASSRASSLARALARGENPAPGGTSSPELGNATPGGGAAGASDLESRS